MKKILFIFMAVATITSCSSDDSPAPVETQNTPILGSWKEIEYTGPGLAETDWTVLDCSDHNTFANIFTFKTDGTYTSSQYCEESINDFPDINGTYTVQNDIVTLNAVDVGPLTYKITMDGTNTLYMHRFVMEDGEMAYGFKFRLEKQ